jgi:hypothetical protein
MGTAWEDRLGEVVFPALLRGLHVYSGLGELIPGHGIPQSDSGSLSAREALTKRPPGLPIWQVYLGVKDTQPAIRFLQFIHKVSNPHGAGALVYPTRLQRDGDRGVAMIIPLGEGLETPPHELFIARELEALILHKPVKVIALGRVRPFTTKSPWSLSEHILMEVYSEGGDCIWTNPIIGLSLEEALRKVEGNEEFRQEASSIPVLPAVVLQENCPTEACVHIVLDRAMDAELSGDLALGLVLRTLALRMKNPMEP